jgi:hypothetical protein
MGCEAFALALLKRGLVNESVELRAILARAMRDKPVRT